MSRKAKPIDDGFSTLNIQESKSEMTEEKSAETKALQSQLLQKPISDEIQKKLELLDQLSSQNDALVRENEDLKDRIGAYIEEIDLLKKDKSQGEDKGTRDLENQVSDLLLKISQITLEKAQLLTQIEELKNPKKEINSPSKQIPIQAQQSRRQRFTLPRSSFDGYSSWN